MKELPILAECHATFYTRRANVRLLDILVRAVPRSRQCGLKVEQRESMPSDEASEGIYSSGSGAGVDDSEGFA